MGDKKPDEQDNGKPDFPLPATESQVRPLVMVFKYFSLLSIAYSAGSNNKLGGQKISKMPRLEVTRSKAWPEYLLSTPLAGFPLQVVALAAPTLSPDQRGYVSPAERAMSSAPQG
jgi:hypothetical protein